jgi:hypothetical protein
VPGPTTYIPGSSPTLASSPPTQNAPGPPTQVTPAAATRVSPAVATKVSAPPSVRRPAPASPEPRGSKTGLILGLLAGAFVLLLAAGVGAFLFLRSRSAPSPSPIAGPGTTPSTTVAAQPSPEAPPSAVATPPPVTNPEASAPPVTTLPAAHATPAPSTEGGRRTARSEPPATTLPPPVDEGPGSILDREPPEEDGRAAGEHAAGTYRESRGGTSSSFGTNRRFGQRARFPRTNQPAERKAIFVLLNVISFEEAYQKMHGRYGTFQEVLPTGGALPHPNAFQRHGYRFQLQADKSEFKVVATPLQMGLRPFVADDSGNVRFADE